MRDGCHVPLVIVSKKENTFPHPQYKIESDV